MATCHLCPAATDPVPDDTVLDHIRVMHPDVWDPPQVWPDGSQVVVDATLEPGDFYEGNLS